MSNLNVVAVALALAAGALGGAAYQKAAGVQAEVRRLQTSRSAPVDEGALQGLEGNVNRIATRVATLEMRAQSAARQAEAPPAPQAEAPEPTEGERRGKSPYDLGPVPQDEAQRAARKKLVAAAVTAHWNAWGAKHGLTERQAADLAALQADAAKRRLDNQARLTDREQTQPETRASNQAVGDEVRDKAKALLTADQFAQFEADKGAEWGSSYRKIREAEAKEGSAGAGH